MTQTLRRKLEIRQLMLVSVLGKELSLVRSASVLHTTQPAVSRSLAQLEELLGVRLFERTTRKISPTSAGLSLIQHANRILAEIDLAESELEGLRGGVTGELRLGVLSTFWSEAVSKSLAGAREMLPNVRFILRSLALEGLYADLLAGRIDLMLSHAELTVDLNLVEAHTIYNEKISILAAQSHRLAKRKRTSWTDIANEAWVLPPHDRPVRPKLDRILSVYRTADTHRGTDIQIDVPELALSMLRHGNMLWPTSDRNASTYEAQNLAVKIEMPGEILQGPFCCFRLRNEKMSIAAQVFLTSLRECVAEIHD